MRNFRRRFDIDRLEREVEHARWFGDLLAIWAPAGTAAPFDKTAAEQSPGPCLRLAVRDPGIDMYRLGQCLASVKFGAKLGLRSKVHHKYVSDAAQGQDHAYVNGVGLHLKNRPIETYGGPSDLAAWVRRAESYKQDSDGEKKFVDVICGKPANANVIDLEMGLPARADAEKRVAPRMDLVALEPTPNGGWRIVFWEAKLAGNPELFRAPNAGKKGNISDQIATYRSWLEAKDNQELVADAYMTTCQILVRLHRIAQGLSPGIGPLGQGILSLGSQGVRPEVDPKPRVIIDNRESKSGSLSAGVHLEQLRRATHVQVVNGPSDLALERID